MALDGSATYVISGGLGDIGQRICELMVRWGARNLVVFSRRMLDPKEHHRIESWLQVIAPECEFYSIRCDISSRSQVRQAVSGFKAMGLPRVRGVIQATVILHVSIEVLKDLLTHRLKSYRIALWRI